MAGSRFVSHVRVWLLVAPLMICALAPFIQNDAAFEVSDAEQASVAHLLGQARANEATALANEHFDRWFVHSGALRASFAGSDADTALPDAGASEFGRGWMRHFWLTIYRAVYRAASRIIGCSAGSSSLLPCSTMGRCRGRFGPPAPALRTPSHSTSRRTACSSALALARPPCCSRFACSPIGGRWASAWWAHSAGALRRHSMSASSRQHVF